MKIRQIIGEHLGQLKDLEISKYKRDSKECMPIMILSFYFC